MDFQPWWVQCDPVGGKAIDGGAAVSGQVTHLCSKKEPHVRLSAVTWPGWQWVSKRLQNLHCLISNYDSTLISVSVLSIFDSLSTRKKLLAPRWKSLPGWSGSAAQTYPTPSVLPWNRRLAAQLRIQAMQRSKQNQHNVQAGGFLTSSLTTLHWTSVGSKQVESQKEQLLLWL